MCVIIGIWGDGFHIPISQLKPQATSVLIWKEPLSLLLIRKCTALLPTIDISLQCYACFEGIEIEIEAKEMLFCRFQLPLDDSKIKTNVTGNGKGRVGIADGQSDGRLGTGSQYWISISWPYGPEVSSRDKTDTDFLLLEPPTPFHFH
ncbi:hypothetical protein V6N11_006827 [Hibiscus sabdariffa]|uniref:Uncharacterized protein n=1 Tax=Hibiscus sabdariffa TaxID=183260 RepID=A0ABR2RS38_9ROSI